MCGCQIKKKNGKKKRIKNKGEVKDDQAKWPQQGMHRLVKGIEQKKKEKKRKEKIMCKDFRVVLHILKFLGRTVATKLRICNIV